MVNSDVRIITKPFLHKLSSINSENDELESLLDDITFLKITEKTVSDKNELLKQINDINVKGYAIDCGESYNEFVGVAVPIIDRFGKADYAISIAGPTNRLDRDKFEKIGEELVKTTKEISKLIGF